jgi:hypothetical protein
MPRRPRVAAAAARRPFPRRRRAWVRFAPIAAVQSSDGPLRKRTRQDAKWSFTIRNLPLVVADIVRIRVWPHSIAARFS